MNDLAAEHKSDRQLGPEACEERAVCRLVAAADPASASFLRHLLAQLTQRYVLQEPSGKLTGRRWDYMVDRC